MLWYDYTIYLECDECHAIDEVKEGQSSFVPTVEAATEAKSRGWTISSDGNRLICDKCNLDAKEKWWRENAKPASRSSNCSSSS